MLGLEVVGDDDALSRLTVLNSLAKKQTNSLALAIVQARLALLAGLDAEAKHHIERATELDSENLLVLLLHAELESGRTEALEISDAVWLKKRFNASSSTGRILRLWWWSLCDQLKIQ